MEILLATNNNHKKEEFSQLLPDHKILMPEEIGISLVYEEPHNTFHENALGKALALKGSTELPVLADDSGLCIPALDYAPGVHSARYGNLEGNSLSYQDKMALVLENLKGDKPRDAFFVCSLVLLFDRYRFFHVQETVWGYITQKPEGSGGFGYDPLFFIPEAGKTMAQLSPEGKNRFSHRGRAALKLSLLLREEKGY